MINQWYALILRKKNSYRFFPDKVKKIGTLKKELRSKRITLAILIVLVHLYTMDQVPEFDTNDSVLMQ